MTEMIETDLNIHDPYSLTATDMAIDHHIHQEIGIGSESQGLSPTDSNSLCPPITSVALVCFQCGTMFKRYLSEFKKRASDDTKAFCCRDCWRSHKKRHNVLVECNNCGKPMSVRKSKYDRYSEKVFHCSRECQKGEDVNCDWCGTSFHKKPGDITEKNYCNQDCMYKHMVGENNGNWRGGHLKYYGPDWNRQRNKARERDNNICQECGKTEDYRMLDIHHIIPFKKFGLKNHKEANRLSNLITLCHKCHMAEEVR